MNDDELGRHLGAALRERFPVPNDVDLRSRLERPTPSRSRIRAQVAVALCVAAVAALSVVLALYVSKPSPQPSAARPLTGVTWQGAEPNLTVVFTDHTVRIYDGCTNELHELSVGADALDIGKLLGPAGVCGGALGWPPPVVANFDAVLSSHHLTWQRNGDRLLLTDHKGRSLELHVAGSALSLTGQQWVLQRYDDRREYSHEGNFTAARLLIGQDGTVHADDMCNQLIGSATVTDTTVTFTDLHWTDHSCIDQTARSAAATVHLVLSGTTTYAIRGDELILYGRQGLLIYAPAR